MLPAKDTVNANPVVSGVDQCVDDLCALGCNGVREAMAALEAGQAAVGTEHLDKDDRARVLAELKDVMAVYDARSDSPCCPIAPLSREKT